MRHSLVLVFVATACSACSGGPVLPDPPAIASPPANTGGVSDGFLHVTWTLDGASTPAVCDSDRAGQVAFFVDDDVREYGKFERDCRDFSATLRVAPDTYTVRSMMLDFEGVPLAPEVAVGPLKVESNDTIEVLVALTGRSPTKVAQRKSQPQ